MMLDSTAETPVMSMVDHSRLFPGPLRLVLNEARDTGDPMLLEVAGIAHQEYATGIAVRTPDVWAVPLNSSRLYADRANVERRSQLFRELVEDAPEMAGEEMWLLGREDRATGLLAYLGGTTTETVSDVLPRGEILVPTAGGALPPSLVELCGAEDQALAATGLRAAARYERAQVAYRIPAPLAYLRPIEWSQVTNWERARYHVDSIRSLDRRGYVDAAGARMVAVERGPTEYPRYLGCHGIRVYSREERTR